MRHPAFLCLCLVLSTSPVWAQDYDLVPSPRSEARARAKFYAHFPDGIPNDRPFNGGWYRSGGGDPAAFDFFRQFVGVPITPNSY